MHEGWHQKSGGDMDPKTMVGWQWSYRGQSSGLLVSNSRSNLLGWLLQVLQSVDYHKYERRLRGTALQYAPGENNLKTHNKTFQVPFEENIF